MSIASELTLLNNTKQGIKTAINNKGVTVTNEPFAEYPDKIMLIPNGGGIYESNFIDWVEGTVYHITLPSTLTALRDWSFFYCNKLEEIDIPNSVTTIGIMAFFNCHSLKEITIGTGIQSIGQAAFGNCRDAVSITIKATTPPTLGMNVFQSVPSTTPIYVPSESVLDYQVAWPTLSSRITAIPS